MTSVNQAVWSTWLPGSVPTNCTYDQLVAAREATQADDDKQYILTRLQQLRVLFATTKLPEFQRLILVEVEQLREGLKDEL